uniref:BED-type domain-containing protein n=1 Tax=Lactuca sativa TaxID=4236 RepID=A0A9R1UIX3_LACSA|nr:hypothetical protein LSAT_V11C900506490 [Lactuca sativa]
MDKNNINIISSEPVNIIDDDDDMEEIDVDDDVHVEQNGGTTDKNQGRGRKHSIVWKHFNKPHPVPPEGARTACIHCKKSYVYEPSQNGTSAMLNHSRNLCKFDPLKCQKLGKQALAEIIIIIDELPFSFVEKEGFRYFCNVVRPELELQSRVTIARDILSLYVHEKNKLKELLRKSSQFVCLTTDAWTSCQNINYMVLTVHYIDGEWNLKKRILNFEVISNHKGDTIGKMVESCLITWGIEKVFTITVDNASSNDTTISFLKKKIQNWGHAVLDAQYLHMHCCAHVLNLIVCDGLKDYDPAIQVIRNVVRLEEDGHYARFFNVGPNILLNEVDAKKEYDVTRVGPPSDIDWDVAQAFMVFLKPY